MKAFIGIDASIHSTGLVIRIPEINKIHFTKIVSKLDKKCSPSIRQFKYDWNIDKTSFSTEDISKIVSSFRLCQKIDEVIKKYCSDVTEYEFFIEGSIMPRKISSSHNDLVANNSIVKLYLLTNFKGSTVEVIPPTSLKLSYTGNGSSKRKVNGKFVKIYKTEMEAAFLKEFPRFTVSGKLDDVVDAYALSCYTDNMIIQEERKAAEKLLKAQERAAKRKKSKK